MREGHLQPIRVQTGISDGTTTAIIGGELTENTPVVTGVVATATAARSTGSPLIPQRPGGRGQQGAGAGGARPGAGR